jgi:hypothetical protein
MQRRSARSFLEEVLLKVPDLSQETRDALLETVDDKPGTKRASKLASIIARAETKS